MEDFEILMISGHSNNEETAINRAAWAVAASNVLLDNSKAET